MTDWKLILAEEVQTETYWEYNHSSIQSTSELPYKPCPWDVDTVSKGWLHTLIPVRKKEMICARSPGRCTERRDGSPAKPSCCPCQPLSLLTSRDGDVGDAEVFHAGARGDPADCGSIFCDVGEGNPLGRADHCQGRTENTPHREKR